MGFIDCDAHVVENDSTWDYLEPSETGYRPRVVTASESPGPGLPPSQFWLAGDSWGRRVRGDGNSFGNANLYTGGTTELEDLAARAEDLDALGIDAQLLISTFRLGMEMDNALAEAALSRSFNRWVAERVGDRSDRFPWALRPPLRLMDRTIQELEYGRNHGAVGVHLRGIEHGLFLSDPYFYPLYEKAQDLDMSILIHLGAAARRVDNLPPGQLIWTPPALMEHVHKVMAGLHAIISSDLTQRFPRLRWGFLEAGATWVPAVLQQDARLASSAKDFLTIHHLSGDELAARNIFVTCQSDEDLGYLTTVLGEDVLCTGTDYGHNDIGSELAVHQLLRDARMLPPAVAKKIVDDNGRRLLGIPANFCPAPEVGRIETLPHTFSADHGAPLLRGQLV